MTNADWKLLIALYEKTENNFGRSLAELIIKNDGASADVINPDTGESALMIACRFGLKDTALYLAGVVEDIEGPDAESHLIHAINNKCYQAAKILIERGADTSITDLHGGTLIESIEDKIKIELKIRELILDNIKRESDAKLTVDNELLFKLFDKDNMEIALEKETVERRKRYLQQLIESGEKRTLASLHESMIEKVDALRHKFPNFNEVIDFYLRQLSLCNLSHKKTIKLSPVLMTGAPGIGKTRFASELANTLELYFSIIACGTTSSSFVLAGGCASWNDARPGQVITTLQNCEDANPLLLLDEIDKMGSNKQYDPAAPLYSLLEHDTAKQFIDEMIELPVDASAINWIATSNEISMIPDPILSRFVIVNVREPNKEEMKAITQSIYEDTLTVNSEWGDYFSYNLSDEIIEKLNGIAPRKIKQLLIDACGRTVQRNEPEEYDTYIISKEDLKLSITKGKSNIGFVT